MPHDNIYQQTHIRSRSFSEWPLLAVSVCLLNLLRQHFSIRLHQMVRYQWRLDNIAVGLTTRQESSMSMILTRLHPAWLHDRFVSNVPILRHQGQGDRSGEWYVRCQNKLGIGSSRRILYQVDLSELFSSVPLSYNFVVETCMSIWMGMILDYCSPQ